MGEIQGQNEIQEQDASTRTCLYTLLSGARYNFALVYLF